jgi:hypothetical protein
MKDLPVFGYSVILNLKVGKYYCNNSKCSRKVFAQRFSGIPPGSLKINNRQASKFTVHQN